MENFKQLSIDELQESELEFLEKEQEGEFNFDLREEYGLYDEEFYN